MLQESGRATENERTCKGHDYKKSTSRQWAVHDETDQTMWPKERIVAR